MRLLVALIAAVLAATACAVQPGPRLWMRLPRNLVKEYIYGFFISQRIDNCYHYVEDSNTLLLKCWINETLLDVAVTVRPSQKYIAIDI